MYIMVTSDVTYSVDTVSAQCACVMHYGYVMKSSRFLLLFISIHYVLKRKIYIDLINRENTDYLNV